MSEGYETPGLIATAISKGNATAESVLLEKYYRQVLFVLQRNTQDPELAKDLCQETFRIMIERLRKEPLEDPEKLSSFLHSIAKNLRIAEFRKSERRQTYPDSELIEQTASDQAEQFDELLKERSRIAVRKLIFSMSNERDRTILYRFYIEDHDKEDICLDLGLSIRHFDKVIYRAKQRFKQLVLSEAGKNLEEITI